MTAGNKKKPDWLQNGSYTQLAGEKEFFELSKQYANIVLLFHRTGDQQCRIMDTHLKLLAAKHLEAKFCKINIEDAKFLQQRLRINHTPEILLVKDRMTTDYIVGFQELGGNCDSFSTAMLERRIARSGTISYKGKQKKTCTHYTQST
ncbi:thioredoxin domain-containing protein 9-like [Drosophila obscura]|uniref:thioredoxin domain-containing protein 9-like n=1 Tax=Drosophila obscura TaxID=7282 RepID=UPI001BB152C3|nr:thioredoxin domain-containing protein 9-like [Drosophila obscura]